MEGYFNTYNICTHIIIIIININININVIHKISFKNKTLCIQCPILNNALRFLKNYDTEKCFKRKYGSKRDIKRT